MPGLVLNLRPWETFLVGGHVLQNGAKKAQIRVRDEGAGVLRLSDALHPDEAVTPLARIYYEAQILLLEPHKAEFELRGLLRMLDDAVAAFPGSEALAKARDHAAEQRFFRVLRALKPLLPAESLILSAEKIEDDRNRELKMVGSR